MRPSNVIARRSASGTPVSDPSGVAEPRSIKRHRNATIRIHRTVDIERHGQQRTLDAETHLQHVRIEADTAVRGYRGVCVRDVEFRMIT